MSSPLDDLLVLDFTRVLAGPHCGRMLVDLGANVIKIEPPQGDMSRFGKPRQNSISAGYTQQNCGKRNLSLDLKHPRGLELLRGLARKADVVLENFRPGVMERSGLGYDALAADNARLVYASISGYGQTGRWAGRRAYAPLVHAEMGLLEGFAYYRKIEPAQEPYSHADLYSGLQCLSGILSALYQRERTGLGQRVEVAMAEAMLMAIEQATSTLSGLREQEPRRPLTLASPMLRTRTPNMVTVGGDPILRETFANYCTALERDLGADPRFADTASREKNVDALLDIIQQWALGFDDLDELDAVLERAGLVMGVVRSVAEAGETEWARERGAVVEVSDRGTGTWRVPNTPWRFSNAETGLRGVPAYRGEHNREVLTELLELDTAELDQLEADGVLSSRLPK